jgi:multiple sugar transport system substrate-binding protein/putative aldouronate transport system substrate-binding protein
MDASTLDIDWRNFMNAESTHEYLENNNQIIVAPGCGYVAPDTPSEITTMRSQSRSVIVDYSWRMVFAPDEDTFYRLMDQMQREAKALGYDVVYEEDLNNAKDQDLARKAAAALSIN